MRTAPEIMAIWNAGGPFIGDDGAPHGRVTVEEGWQLQTSGEDLFHLFPSPILGSYKKGPARWFQRKDNAQVETEVPNIKTIQIDRSVDTDAATCTLTIQNTRMLDNGTVPVNAEELGEPGYYTFSRGESEEAVSRWGHTPNEWNEVIVPNALLRTYQGYGGKSKTIVDALADGNIIQTGLWLVDEVHPSTGGDLVVKCRDMGKLLVEQSLYPPLVPRQQYPLFYYRFVNNNHPTIPYGTRLAGTGYTGTPAGKVSTAAPSVRVESVSSEAAGRPKEDACDFGDPTSYWMSGGRTTGSSTSDMEYIQFVPAVGTTMDMGAYDLYPWGGGYHYYVSVMVAGVWQGTDTIPYTGTTPGMAIPYVSLVTREGWEYPELRGINSEGVTYLNAQRIRITFTNLAHTSVGPQFYRCGVRDFTVGTFASYISGEPRVIVGIARNSDTDNDGYYLAGSDGGVFSFGTSRYWGSEAGAILNQEVTNMTTPADNSGYWLVAGDGGVFAFNVPFYGSLPSLGVTPSGQVIAIERSEGGKGYFMASSLGGVYAIGDAIYHGNFTAGGLTVALAVRAQGGYWVVNSGGTVQAFGAATHHGDTHALPISSAIVAMAATSTGNGYWLLGFDGAVYAFGDATYFGGMNGIGLRDPACDIEGFADNTGYWIVGEDGGVFTFPLGGYGFWGSLPQAFDFETAGNYSDWSDIIKDLLLWSGFWLQDTLTSSDAPEVFGNVESTGAFALDNLTEDFFDKKPVIDVIHAIREIVGYAVYVDDQGGFHFHPSNIWALGNFYEDGTPTLTIPVVDEAIQITEYQIAFSDKDALSSITIASSDPQDADTDLIATTRFSTTGSGLLKGIVKNALWVNGAFINADEQAILAELIDLYTFFAERQGSVTCVANPAISINDQVRIFERQTSETYVHYVSGVSTTMDLVGGDYMMTLTTHWLGDGTDWFLVYN